MSEISSGVDRVVFYDASTQLSGSNTHIVGKGSCKKQTNSKAYHKLEDCVYTDTQHQSTLSQLAFGDNSQVDRSEVDCALKGKKVGLWRRMCQCFTKQNRTKNVNTSLVNEEVKTQK